MCVADGDVSEVEIRVQLSADLYRGRIMGDFRLRGLLPIRELEMERCGKGREILPDKGSKGWAEGDKIKEPAQGDYEGKEGETD